MTAGECLSLPRRAVAGLSGWPAPRRCWRRARRVGMGHGYLTLCSAAGRPARQVLEARVDHARVVDLLRKADHLPLVKEYLLAVQKTNLGAINEAVRRPYPTLAPTLVPAGRAENQPGRDQQGRAPSPAWPASCPAPSRPASHGKVAQTRVDLRRDASERTESRCSDPWSKPLAARMKTLLMRGLHRAAPCWRKPACLASPERLAVCQAGGGTAGAQRR